MRISQTEKCCPTKTLRGHFHKPEKYLLPFRIMGSLLNYVEQMCPNKIQISNIGKLSTLKQYRKENQLSDKSQQKTNNKIGMQ